MIGDMNLISDSCGLLYQLKDGWEFFQHQMQKIILCKMRFSPREMRLNIGKLDKLGKLEFLKFYKFSNFSDIWFNLTSQGSNIIMHGSNLTSPGLNLISRKLSNDALN